jgi:hypothetical protein
VTKKCHTTSPHSWDSLSMRSECIPLFTPSMEGPLHSGIFGSWHGYYYRRSGPIISLTKRLRSKRAIQAIPLLATLGITATMGTSIHYYTKL